jgi:predicted AlkP superfamily pyrophosphatase or phosphodiesterase
LNPCFSPFGRLLVVLLLPIVASGWVISARAEPGAVTAPASLILVSIDGYRADYLDRGHSAALAALASDGVRAKGMRPVYPSLTYPNHYTLVTGLYPDQHGMVNNTMHDPILGSFSPPNRAANTDGRWWDGAEPIWASAQKQGIRTASVFYPGTQAEIRGVRPSYWQLFDSSVPPDARVDQVLTWLDLAPAERPKFISLYFEQVDVAGHLYGPDSLQVNEAIVTVDCAIARLVAGLRLRDSFDATNLIILSDHGMSATSPDRMVLLDQFLNVEHIQLTSSIVNAGIDARPGYEAEVERALLAPHPHLHCWKKRNLPARFHYGRNPRIPAIQCLTRDGWMVSTAAIEAKRTQPLLGEHGYDNNDPKMRALFVAHGPSFKQHLAVPVFDNVHVYALLSELIGVKPLPNEGSPGATADMLRAKVGVADW